MKQFLIIICLVLSGGYVSGQVLLQNIEDAHTGNVISLDSDATGSVLLSGGVDNRAHIWDANTGQKIKSFSDLKGYPAVLFFDSGRKFITSSYSGKTIIWDADTKKPVSMLKGNDTDILSLAFNPVNNNIAGGSRDGKILIWDKDGKLLITFIGHGSEVKSVAFNPEGTKLISAGVGEVKIWEANRFTPLGTLQPDSKSVITIKGSCNLDQIAIVSGKRTIEIWNTTTFSKDFDLTAISHEIMSVEFSSDDKYIAVGGVDGSLSIINLSSKTVTSEMIKAHDSGVAGLKFTVDGQRLITGGNDGRIKVWSMGSLNIQASLAYQKTQALFTQNQVSPAQNQDETLYRGDILKGLGVTYSAKDLQFGDYYALIIGIDSYTGQWRPLKNAVGDAKAIQQLLQSKYKFDYLKVLYNEQATRMNIIKELEWLVQNVKPTDNLLIYYSGHGEFNQTLNKGYWVPVDATAASTSYYISNSDIQTFLGGIKSKHTLLISDACFSGDIFRGNTVSVPFEESDKYYAKVNSVSSRKAITSGGVEPVMDGGREGHSVFAYYLLKSLSGNEKKYYDASQLFDNIKIPVLNNSDQSPQFNAIKNAGDEGGQFIFLKK